jgi:hypothetical protein
MTEKNDNQNQNKNILITVLVVLAIIFAFILGVKFGRKEFYYRYPAFMHPMMKLPKEGFVPSRFRGHGLIGIVDSVGKESFVVKSRWGELLTVLVDKNTQYKVDGKTGSFSDIKKGKTVIILGEPKEEELSVKAEIIRIF